MTLTCRKALNPSPNYAPREQGYWGQPLGGNDSGCKWLQMAIPLAMLTMQEGVVTDLASMTRVWYCMLPVRDCVFTCVHNRIFSTLLNPRVGGVLEHK